MGNLFKDGGIKNLRNKKVGKIFSKEIENWESGEFKKMKNFG